MEDDYVQLELRKHLLRDRWFSYSIATLDTSDKGLLQRNLQSFFFPLALNPKFLFRSNIVRTNVKYISPSSRIAARNP
jgi:hypothetical protein